MLSKIAVALAMLVVLGLPFLFRPKAAEVPADAMRLVVITPHHEQIRAEFERAFSAWHQERFGVPVVIDWRQPGGTSEIRKQLRAQYSAAVDTGRIAPDGSAEPGTMSYDLLFGGGSYEHSQMKRGVTVTVDGADVTVPISAPAGFSEEQMSQWFPLDELGGEPLYDPEQYWIGVALSSFGIVYNTDALEAIGVETPKSWDDLRDPAYQGWLAMADPRASGSVATAFQKILDGYGWEKGWATLRDLSANARYFSGSSRRPPLDVSAGEAAAGVAIDFYGRSQSDAILAPGQRPEDSRVQYVDPKGAVFFDPDPITLLRGAPNPELARRFIAFLLSPEGQAVWQMPARGEEPGLGPVENELRRLPIRRAMYEDHFTNFIDKVNPYEIAEPLPNRGWRSMIGPMMGAFGIDNHTELEHAWLALNEVRESGDKALTAELEALFYAMPTHVMPDGTELEFNAENYSTIRNEWRDPEIAARAKIGYTMFFRRNYEEIVRRAGG
jgi:ABC-type Fe3+ transport system substrate-binding protein